MKLLEIAKGISTNKRHAHSQEEIELVMAWVNDEITLNQASKALERGESKFSKTYFYGLAANVLKEHLSVKR